MFDFFLKWASLSLILTGMIAGLFVLAFGAYMTPKFLQAEKTCLSKGFPKYSVTYDGEAYCMNMEGAVTIKVQKQ